MHGSYAASPVSYEHARRICEAMCEGVVLSMMAEMEARPEDFLPCCIKCGGFSIEGDHLCPPACTPLDELFGRFQFGGEPYDHQNIVPGYTLHPPKSVFDVREAPPQFHLLRFRSPQHIVRAGSGTTLELACYQCAGKRLRGNDPGARVVVFECEPGTFRGAVLNSMDHEDPEKRGKIDDPVVHATITGPCPCEVGEGYPEGLMPNGGHDHGDDGHHDEDGGYAED